MAGKSGIARLLERVRPTFVKELDINKLLPRLLSRGLFSVSEEKGILSHSNPKKRIDILLNILSSKDRVAFAEFCNSLEECAPHLLTSLVLENQQGEDLVREDNPPTQALQLGFELALKERDAVLRENARAQEERDNALRKLETIKIERDQALASLENISTKQGKLKDGMSSLERISRTDSKKMKDTPVVVETDQAYEENGPNVVWETHQVTLYKAPTFGFGIAVSGGRDTPHFANGDPSVAISDVLKAGPAEGRLQINDRIMTVNGTSLENVDHATAINVLRDCGNTVNLVVRRRILLPVSQTERLTPPFKITLSKKNKKDDFGIVLGCKLYIKEIIPHSLAAHEHTLREGDTVLKINNTPAENISLTDARKLVDKSKEKLQLIVSKDRRADFNIPSLLSTSEAAGIDTELFPPRVRDKDDVNVYRPSVRSEEDIYVKDPTSSVRHAVPAGAYPNSENTRFDGHYVLDNDPPTRLPLTRSMENNISDQHQKEGDVFRSGRRDIPDGYYSDQEDVWRNRQDFTNQERGGDYIDDVFRPNLSIHERYVDMRSDIRLEPRRVSFLKDKQTGLGLRLAGGNATGIFIASVQPGSAGEREGLVEGDQIILANDKEITGLTREEAVSYLTSLVGEVTMVVQYKKEEYDCIMASHEAGDSFKIRVHFNHTAADAATEHSFKIGDLFHVKDTLFRGIGGSWLAVRISEDPGENKKGTIPNSKTAEILKAQQGDDNNKENFPNRGRGSLFKRKSSSRRSKSLGKDHWDEVIFDENEEAGLNTKFPAYERIVLREPGFVRPVVIFGAVADIARERLLTDYPDKYDSPQVEKSTGVGDKKEKTAIIRLGSIRDAITHRKHCLLDVTPQNVDRLNYAQYNPIVIFMKADSKQAVKDIRSRWKTSSRNPRKLLEQSEKIEKTYSHLFTSVLKHMGTDAWFPKLCEMIDAQQRQQIWMSEKQPQEDMSDDFMFPMSTRLSLAAGAESDLDIPRPRDDMDVSPIRKKQLMRSSSDPSVNTHENIPGIPPYPSPPTYKIQKLPLEISLSDASPRSPARDDFQVHPEDRYYPSYYSDHLSSPKHYLANRSNIDPYATLTPSERLQARTQTDQFHGHFEDFRAYREKQDLTDKTKENLVSQHSPQNQPHPGLAGDNRVHNDSSSHSSDSYSKYVNSPQNKHDDTKLREKFGNLQISGREKSPGHDPYRFTRSTANPISVSVDPAKLSDLSARYRKQEGQTKINTTKQVAPPTNQAPIKKKEPPPVPAKTISLKQRGIEPDELKMRNYENSNRAYNYADVNNASSRYGPSGTPPVPPPPSSTSYPGGLDTDRPYEYMSVRQAQNPLNNRQDVGGSSNRLDGGLRSDLSPLHHNNIPSGYNKGSMHSFQPSLAPDLQRQQFYQGGRGFSMDSGLQPPPLPPHPSDQDYYDSKAYTNEVYMEHGDLQRARLTRIQPAGFSSIPQQGLRDGGRELYQGVVLPALDGGYTRPRTDDEQLEDLQHSKWRAKSETRLAEVSNIYARWNNTNSHSNLRISNVDEDITNNNTSNVGSFSNGNLWQGQRNYNRGRNANRYKSWDTAKHEHDMFSAYTKLITTQAFVPQKCHMSGSSMELRAENYPWQTPESAFKSYKQLTKQASFSGTSGSNPPETNWRTGRSGDRSRPTPNSVPPRSHSVGSILKTSVVSPPLASPSVNDMSAIPYPPVAHTIKSADVKLAVQPVNSDLNEAEDSYPQLPPPPADLPFLFSIMPLPPPPPISELFKSPQNSPPTEPPPPPPFKTFPLPPVSKETKNSTNLSELKGWRVGEGVDGLLESSGSKSHIGVGDKHNDFKSLDENHTIIATAKGIFTSKGGLLESQETGVSIFIPEGAIEENFDQEIYFKVCRDNSLLPPLDTEKGETLLSPLVMCGPHGIQFKKPVELRLPHCASANPESWSFALKSSDSPSGKTTEWQNMTLAGSEGVSKGRVDQSSVSILVDHF